jgi:hypothetical protein
VSYKIEIAPALLLFLLLLKKNELHFVNKKSVEGAIFPTVVAVA